MRAGIDELRALHRREVRVAPGVRMEHRHDRHDGVVDAEAEPERVVRADAERVQDGRAVRVDDAARPARRAARVTHRGGLALVELRVLPLVRIGGREQLLVRVLHDPDVLDLRPLPELVEQRQERAVDDHGPVAGVIRDVVEVVRMEAEVERVEDEAAARDAEVRLVVLVVVPAERRHAVAALETRLLQRDGQLPRTAHRVAVVRAVEALVGQARDDLAVAEERLRAAQQVRQRQREVHHQAVHPAHSPMRERRPRLRDAARRAGGRSLRARGRACRTGAAGAPT